MEGVSELASPTTMTRRFQISFSSLDFDLLSMCVVQIGRLELSWQQQGSGDTMTYLYDENIPLLVLDNHISLSPNEIEDVLV